MKRGLYSICDTVAEEFGEPFLAVNDAIAVRCFHLGLSKVDPMVKPDYRLYQVGFFDIESGMISENVRLKFRLMS